MSKNRKSICLDAPNGTAFLGLLVLIIMMFANFGMSADLWVDRNSIGGQCQDGRDRAEVSQSTPWCTLVPPKTRVQPGDVVHVREGVYTEKVGYLSALETAVSGTAQSPITFMAESGETVILSGIGPASRGIQFADWSNSNLGPFYIVVSGFIIQDFDEAGVNIVNVGDITVKDVEIKNCTGNAVSARHSWNITIEDSQIHDNPMTSWTSGISILETSGTNVVRGNSIWANIDLDPRDSEGHGIILDYCDDSTATFLIENNLIWDNEGWCIALYHSDGATVRNNTCYLNGLNRPGTGELSVKGVRHSIYNNIFVSRDGAPAMYIRDYPGVSSVESDYNLLWSPDHSDVAAWIWSDGTLAEYQALNPHGWDQNSVQIDPQLADPVNAVFELTGSSPVIDYGDDSVAASMDIDKRSRPIDGNGDGQTRVDLGAYEYAFGMLHLEDFETGDLEGWMIVVD